MKFRTTGFLFALLLSAVLSACSGHGGPAAGQISSATSHTDQQELSRYPESQQQALFNARTAYIEGVQAKLPSGTRVYTMPMLHVYDPVRRLNTDFPADSLITRSSSETIVTPPDQAARVFSAQAQITRDPSNVMYFYVRPGEAVPPFVQQHARIDHVIK